jgi:hypothetical protein
LRPTPLCRSPRQFPTLHRTRLVRVPRQFLPPPGKPRLRKMALPAVSLHRTARGPAAPARAGATTAPSPDPRLLTLGHRLASFRSARPLDTICRTLRAPNSAMTKPSHNPRPMGRCPSPDDYDKVKLLPWHCPKALDP